MPNKTFCQLYECTIYENIYVEKEEKRRNLHAANHLIQIQNVHKSQRNADTHKRFQQRQKWQSQKSDKIANKQMNEWSKIKLKMRPFRCAHKHNSDAIITTFIQFVVQ